MDLRLTEEELAFRAEVRAFVRDNLPASIREKMVAGRRLGKDDIVRWTRILAAKGWSVPHWPREWGGTGWSPIKQSIFHDEMQRGNAPESLAFGVSMVGPVIYTFGSQAQKERFLPRIVDLRDWWCQGFSEPGAGSDLAGLRTSARREGDGWVINGQKTWTTLAQYADWIFVLARTDAQVKKQEGISFFLVDMKSPGITVRPIQTIDGGHEVNEVFLDNVRVPLEKIVGEENKGWDYAKFLLGNERNGIARVGVSKARLDRIRELAAIPVYGARPKIDGSVVPREARRGRGRAEGAGNDPDARDLQPPQSRQARSRLFGAQDQGLGNPAGDDRVADGRGRPLRPALPRSRTTDAGTSRRSARIGRRRSRRPISTRARSRSTAGRTKSSAASSPRRSWGSETMDFDLSDEQEQLRDNVARLMKDRYGFEARKAYQARPQGWSEDLWRQYAEIGLLGAPFAEADGGFGGGAVETMIVMEEFGRALALEPYLPTVVLGGGLLRHGASAEQRAELIAAIAAGELRLGFAHAERQSGFDLFDVAPSAGKDGGGGFVLEWRKGARRPGDSAEQVDRLGAPQGRAARKGGHRPVPRRRATRPA